MKKLFTLMTAAIFSLAVSAQDGPKIPIHIESSGSWAGPSLSKEVPFEFDKYVGYEVRVANVEGPWQLLIESVETHKAKVSWSDDPIDESDCIMYIGVQEGVVKGEFNETMAAKGCTQGIRTFNLRTADGTGTIDVLEVYLVKADGTKVAQEVNSEWTGWNYVITEYEAPSVVINLDIPVQKLPFVSTNGDASQEYDQSIPFEGEGFDPTVIAWGKEAKGNPHPAFVEDGAFVVHATAMESNPWDNQFWICVPQKMMKGDSFKLKFRYKATSEASVGTQAHANPSNYNHYMCIGNIDFKTDWQTYEGEVTLDGSMAPEGKGFYSIAFNLNDYNPANDYYIDDIEFSGIATAVEEKEGWFVATDQNGRPQEMTRIEDGSDLEGCYGITVGTEEKPVQGVWISTKTGSTDLYKAGALKFALPEDFEPSLDEWMEYTVGNGKTIALPEAGVWTILVDPEGYICIANGKDFDGINNVTADKTFSRYTFNLAGQKVGADYKGIVIQNGKKFIVK